MAEVTGAGGAAVRLRRWALWLVVLGAVVVALVVGSTPTATPTLDQRVHSLAAQVRCPVCQGESAADSQVPAAVAIRVQIRQDLSAGASPSTVLDHLVTAYSAGLLEKPRAQGVGVLVYLVPIVAASVAAIGLGLAFRRWRRPPGGEATGGDPGNDGDSDLVARALGDRGGTGHP